MAGGDRKHARTKRSPSAARYKAERRDEKNARLRAARHKRWQAKKREHMQWWAHRHGVHAVVVNARETRKMVRAKRNSSEVTT